MKEVWKDISNYEGLYKISNFGNVISLKNRWSERKAPKKVKSHITDKNYKRIALCKNNNQKLFMVHDLVAKTFIRNFNYPEEEINHKDKNRLNNCVDNLEIISHIENIRYSKSKKVIQYDLNGDFIKQWNSTREIENNLKLNHTCISDCCNGKQKTAYGYIWKYKED